MDILGLVGPAALSVARTQRKLFFEELTQVLNTWRHPSEVGVILRNGAHGCWGCGSLWIRNEVTGMGCPHCGALSFFEVPVIHEQEGTPQKERATNMDSVHYIWHILCLLPPQWASVLVRNLMVWAKGLLKRPKLLVDVTVLISPPILHMDFQITLYTQEGCTENFSNAEPKWPKWERKGMRMLAPHWCGFCGRPKVQGATISELGQMHSFWQGAMCVRLVAGEDPAGKELALHSTWQPGTIPLRGVLPVSDRFRYDCRPFHAPPPQMPQWVKHLERVAPPPFIQQPWGDHHSH